MSRIAIICFAIAASLLAFPHWLPWVTFAWMLVALARQWKGRSPRFPLLACAAIMLVRGVPFLPSIVVLLIVLVSAAMLSQRRPVLSQIVLWSAFSWMVLQYRGEVHYANPVSLDAKRPVLCIGDSLTQGMIPDPGYPGALRPMLTIPVVNRGVSGISTGPAIALLQRSLKEFAPQIVVLELGGHDFLKWHRRSTTKHNLLRMVAMCHAADARVVLMEIPRGFMVDPYFGIERCVAYETGIELLDDRWLRHTVLMSPIAPPGRWMPHAHLSDDGIHSNPRGSKVIAAKVANAICNVLGPEAISSPPVPSADISR